MSDQDIPHSVWSGSFRVFGIDIKCHVLSNGQRVVEAASVDALVDELNLHPNKDYDTEVAALYSWIRGEPDRDGV